jgi:hypothetical protein
MSEGMLVECRVAAFGGVQHRLVNNGVSMSMSMILRAALSPRLYGTVSLHPC